MYRFLLAGVAGLLSIAAAQAAPIDASTSITNGGLTFSNFSCITNVTSGSNTNGNCSGLSVNAFASAGIEFTGGLSAGGQNSSASTLDVVIKYQVTASNAQAPLTGLGLRFNGQTFGPGIASASITEDAFASLEGASIGRVAVNDPFGPSSASVAFTTSVTTAYITKDILLTANPGGGGFSQATISFIDQTFTGGGGGGGGGGGTPVPEPISLAVFGAGLVGLGLVRRAKRS